MAEMNLLGIVQEFCKRRGLPVPPVAIAATDDTTQQMIGLLNEGVQDLTDRYFYQALIQTAEIAYSTDNTSNLLMVNLSSQYPDFKAMVAKTFWDVTNGLPVEGPLTASQWQQVTVTKAAPASHVYRLYQNGIYIYPVTLAPAVTRYRFEYLSRFGVWNPVSNLATEFYTVDTAYPRLPAYVVLADLKWRWERDRGFPYAEDQRTCEEMVTNLVGREPGQELDMGCASGEATPGLYVAAGNWPL